MKVILVILFYCFASSTAEILENGREAVEPEYLDYLLKEKNYEEFNRLMEIDIPHLSRPKHENDTTHPRYNRHLEHGDILLTPRQKEEDRQVIDFSKYKTRKWWDGEVCVYISKEYTTAERRYIWSCIQKCNKDMYPCIKFIWCGNGEKKDYIYFFPGDGCYSNLGRVGGQQSLSLDRKGCLDEGTTCHELLHALGFTHEHNRSDRDNHIKIRWEDIKKGWDTQFKKNSVSAFQNYGEYDCCSLMHYPAEHPDLCEPGKRAFDITDPKCNPSCCGNADAMTAMDKQKLYDAYC